MLPIQTVEGVLNDMSTGSIIDLSEYLKKTEGVSKTELDELKVVISNKLDVEPQHKHHIDDIKQLANELNSKFDKGERYPHNTILNDTEKISYLEAPKIELLELVKDKESEGYKFYVDESNGDLMITLNGVLIGSYSIASGKWSWESNGNYADADHNHDAKYSDINHNHDDKYAEVGHTHNTINNALTVTGNLTANELTITGGYMTGPCFSANSEKLTVTQHLNCENAGAYFCETVTMDSDLIVRNENVMAKIAALQTKITEMEAVLQNHYQALVLLLEKHEMIDMDTSDGANITTGNA